MVLNDREILLLVDLYDALMSQGKDHLDLEEWGARKGVDREEAFRAFHELESEDLADSPYVGATAKITPEGVRHAENEGLAAADAAAHHDKVRKVVLDQLLDARESDGPKGMRDWMRIVRDGDLDEDAFHLNLWVLRGWGYVESAAGSMFRLTDLGIKAARYLRRADSTEGRWDALHAPGMAPHARGHDFERLLGDVAHEEGWTVELNVRSPGEENDLILSKPFTYLVVSCKWLTPRVPSSEVRDLQMKVSVRPTSIGVLASVSGFTSEAVEWARDHLNTAPVLLFGPSDLDSVFRGGTTLTDLLLSKHSALMTRRTVEVE